MTRATRFFALAAAAATLWLLLVLDVLPMPLMGHEAKHDILAAVSAGAHTSSTGIHG